MTASARIAVVIATTGRAAIVDRTAPLWLRQTRPFDRLILSAASEADIGPQARAIPGVEILVGPKGSCHQRNTALDAVGADCPIVAFADDDYLPSRRFLALTEAILAAEPDIHCLTGHVIADGARSQGIAFDDALAIIDASDASPAQEGFKLIPAAHGYGCNLVARMAAAPAVRFDERLPLYGWMEDLDFSRRVAAQGRIMRSMALLGVHMGVKSGRQPGVRLGYSQVANIAYLAGKGSMPWTEAAAQIGRNVAANAAKALFPEPWVDRKGRLRGNVIAFGDGLAGRLRPERVLEL
ncbi:MAG: glycosyltransferase family A protein [Hyphomonadaceae bacterium]|nr:glycosyltransferase family A protein [Hyphomonadaceae bacterium]